MFLCFMSLICKAEYPLFDDNEVYEFDFPDSTWYDKQPTETVCMSFVDDDYAWFYKLHFRHPFNLDEFIDFDKRRIERYFQEKGLDPVTTMLKIDSLMSGQFKDRLTYRSPELAMSLSYLVANKENINIHQNGLMLKSASDSMLICKTPNITIGEIESSVCNLRLFDEKGCLVDYDENEESLFFNELNSVMKTSESFMDCCTIVVKKKQLSEPFIILKENKAPRRIKNLKRINSYLDGYLSKHPNVKEVIVTVRNVR